MSCRARIRQSAKLASYCAGAVAAAVMVAAAPAAAGSLVPSAAISMPNGESLTSFDISYVNPDTGTYILADRTNKAVDVINTHTNTVIMQAGQGLFVGATSSNDTSGPNGAMIVGNTIYAGDGNSTLKVLSLSTGQLLNTINTGGSARVDEMCNDPVDNIAEIANDADTPPFITFFNTSNPSSPTIIKQIKFDGAAGDGPNATNGIEQCQYNPRDGNFYLNVPEVNGSGGNTAPGETLVISPTTQTILAAYVIPLSACSGPQGMAIGPAPQILLGCNGGPSQPQFGFPTAVINDGTTGGTQGDIYAVLTNETGSDEVDYNPATDLYVLAESSFNPPPPNGTASCTAPITAGPQEIGIVSAPNDVELPSIPNGLYNCPAPNAHGGNHSVAADRGTGKVFVPVASTSGSTLCGTYGGSNTTGCVLVLIPQEVDVASHDFNGDHRSDILWIDSSNNVSAWLMDGATVAQSGTYGAVTSAWSLVGQRDFNGDGKYDLLWRDTSGDTAIWLLNGLSILQSAGIGNVPTVWSVIGTGDFNGNGDGDILWRDTSGDVALWLMNGTQVAQSCALGNVPTTTSAAGIADFNGDGKADILWRDNAGNTSIWLMNGCSILQEGSLGNVPTTFSVVGTGDFNGDGKWDILWRDSSSNLSIWLMNTFTIIQSGGIGAVPSTTLVAQTGDYNGDGMSDILLRNSSTGNTTIWFMNGLTVSQASSLGTIPTTFALQGQNAD
jgi:hypothetical protein